MKENGGAGNEEDAMDLDQDDEMNSGELEMDEGSGGPERSANENTTLKKSKKDRKSLRKSHSKQLVPEEAEEDVTNATQASANLFLTQPDIEEPKSTRKKRNSTREFQEQDQEFSVFDLPEESEGGASLQLEKKRRRSRRSNEHTKSRTKSAEAESEENEAVPESQTLDVEHAEPLHYSQDMVGVMNQAMRTKSMEAKVKKPRKSRKKTFENETREEETDDLLSAPARLKSILEGLGSAFEGEAREYNAPKNSDTPKISKKRKSRGTVSQEPAVEEDAHDVEMQLQKDIELASAGDAEDDDPQAPNPPSKKALGKRKAPDTLAYTLHKRQKSLKNKIPLVDLEKFGFTSSSSGRNSQLENDLAQQARDLYARHAEDDISMSTSAILPPLKSLPQGLVESASQTRRPTPKFAPVNAGSAPPHTPANLGNGSPKTRTKSSRKARQSKENAAVDHSDSNVPRDTSVEELTEMHTEVEDRISSDSAPKPVAPKSSERRKRRLPTGEPSSVIKTPSNKTPKEAKLKRSAPNTPKPPVTPGGRITTGQINAIREAVESYGEQNDMSEVELNAMIQKDTKEAPEFWNYMFEEIQDITRRKLLAVCRRTFHNFEARGAWTEEQDEELREAYEKFNGKWKPIGQALNRYHEDCRDRWRNYLVCGNNMKKDVWDKEEEDRLREVVKECVEAVLELKHAANDSRFDGKDPETLIDWNVVSSKMDYTRSRLQCVTKWKKLKDRQDDDLDDPVAAMPVSETWRLEVAEKNARIMSATEKLQFLYLLRDSGAGREGKIPWTMIQDVLGLKGQRMVLKVCFRRLKEHVPDHEDMKLQDIVQFLIDDYEAAAPNEPRHYKSAFEAEGNSKKRRKRKSKPTENNGEGSSTIVEKSKRHSMRHGRQDFIVKENGEGSSRLKRHNPKSMAVIGLEESDADAAETPSVNKKKRKFRQRMKSEYEEPSQESESQHLASESSIGAAFDSVKDKKSKSTRKSKKKRALSEYRVVENEESEESAPEQETRASEYEQEIGEAMVKDELSNGRPHHQTNGNSYEESGQDIEDPMDEDVIPNGTSNRDIDEEKDKAIIDDLSEMQEDSDDGSPPVISGLPVTDAADEDDDSTQSQNELREHSLPQIVPDILVNGMFGEEDESAQSQSEADERSPPPTFHRAGSQRQNRTIPAQNRRTPYVDGMVGDNFAAFERDDGDSSQDEDEKPEVESESEREDELEDARNEFPGAEDEIDLDNNTRHFRNQSVEPDTKTAESSDEEEEGDDFVNRTYHTEPSPDLDNQDEQESFHSEASPDLDEKRPSDTNGISIGKEEDSDEGRVKGQRLPLRLNSQKTESPPHNNTFTAINAINGVVNAAISSDDDDEDIPAVPISKPKLKKEKRKKGKRSSKRERVASQEI